MNVVSETRSTLKFGQLAHQQQWDLTRCQQTNVAKEIVIKITFTSVQFNAEQGMLFLQHARC